MEIISAVTFDPGKFAGHYLLYQSSEDTESLYKSHIEDAFLGLSFVGAKLLAKYEFFEPITTES